MKTKDNASKSRSWAIVGLETLVIVALSLYVAFGAGLFIKHHCWDTLTPQQQDQILEQMSRNAQENTLLT